MTSTLHGLGSTTLAAAHVAHMHDADFFFFKPEDVDPVNETIEGLFFRNGRWERCRTPFPDVVENTIAQEIASEPWQALVRLCRITTPYLGGKLAVDEAMRRSDHFDDILIPTALVESSDHLIEEVAHYKRVVVKPEFGNQGRGIMYVAERGASFFVNVDGMNHRFALPALKAFVAPRLKNERHVVQQYVESRTELGQPYSIRIHLRRDGNAEWRHVLMFSRIGSGASVVSNVATGGSLVEAHTFLKHRFGDAAELAFRRLLQISEQFPPTFQSIYPDRTIPALGIDLGLDSEGHPRLFEVNSCPSAQYGPFVDHMWRIGYAIYLVKNPNAPDGMIRSE